MKFFSALKNIIQSFEWFSDRTINSIKITIACFIALCLVEFPGSPLNQWTLLSIVVVMSQVNLGGILKKSYDRIMGTLIGALVAGIAVLFFEHHTLILDIILLVSCLIFAYVAGGSGDNKQMGTLGSATAIMILLARPPSESIIFLRPLEIIIGILIALLVTHFVFPIRATTRLRMSLGEGLDQLKDLFEWDVDTINPTSLAAIKQTEEKLLKVFVNQRELMKDSKTEHHNRIKKSTLYELVTHERQLHRAILLTAYTMQDNSSAANILRSLPSYQKVKQDIGEQLNFFATILKAHTISSIPSIVPIDLTELISALQNCSITEPVFEVRVHIDAFIVAIQFFVKELTILAKKIQEITV